MEQSHLHLYVVGDKGDPENWSEYGARKLVIAESREQALDLADAPSDGQVHLFEMSAPAVIVSEYYRGD